MEEDKPNNSRLNGAPLYTPFFIFVAVSGKEVNTHSHFLAESLLASPNEKSLSCAKQGIFSFLAAKTTGKATKPPLEKTAFG